MIICPASGCRYFIGDQDYDTDLPRCTTKLGSCANLDIKDASIHLTRQEESVRASTRGTAALYHKVGEPRYSLTRLPGIAYGCEAYAGSRVLIIETREVTAKDAEALEGSQPARPHDHTSAGERHAWRQAQVLEAITQLGARTSALPPAPRASGKPTCTS